jgi:hypothetical protein
MRTKALEWVKHPHAELWRAYCLLGCYQVAAISSPISWGFDGFDGVTKVADEALTEDAAFAAAQSHFDASIASVLEDDWQTMAAKDVLAERRRQVEAEGWTPEHDDQHTRGELARAAASYAVGGGLFRVNAMQVPQQVWPYRWEYNPSDDERRNLVKAGALILAEIERLDRLPSPPKAGE